MSFINKLFSNNTSTQSQTTSAPETSPAAKNSPECTVPEHSEIYYPDRSEIVPAKVERIELTEKQAVEQGWSFRKKSKRIRITNYHGTERNIIIPSKIGDMIVNEIGSQAFVSKDIDSVEIPSTIYRVCVGAFRHSKVQKVIFAEGTRIIMATAFYNCENLHEVHLPESLTVLGQSAFERCRSLDYISLSSRLRTVGKETFRSSGLCGFSSPNRFTLTDGSIFWGTPIHQHYKLLVTYDAYDKMDILLVGIKAEVKFRKGSDVSLYKNAVHSSCILDFSECASIFLNTETYYDKRNRFGSRDWYMECKAIVPEGNASRNLYFPDYVKVRYPDGRRYRDNVEITEYDSRDMHVILHSNPHSWTVRTFAEKLYIDSNYTLNPGKYAFDESKLKSIHFNCIQSENEIFSPYCHNLREVHYEESDTPVTRYIPPEELIGRALHLKLLTAFTIAERYEPQQLPRTDDVRYEKVYYFYESAVISEIFSKGYFEYEAWNYSKRTHNLNQRSKIFIAIDILRSSKAAHDVDTKIYSDYLRTHKRYAEIICEKVWEEYPEYWEFLETFEF